MVDILAEHERLFTESGRILGKTLWMLVRADQRMEELRVVTQSTDGPSRLQFTEFSNEVGGDEIYWWICKKETDVGELLKRTHELLPILQTLKEHSTKLARFHTSSYAELIAVIAKFLSKYHAQVAELHEFVTWLRSKDPLAPTIMFSEAVWGSTRRSDRRVEIPNDLDAEQTEKLFRLLIERACGVNVYGTHRYVQVSGEIDYRRHESDPENYVYVEPEEADVMVATCPEVLSEFAVFFEQLRQSLRRIRTVSERCLAERNLLSSPAFWQRFILKAKNPVHSESPLWDFKKTLTMWGAPSSFAAEAQFEVCKSLAAFANHQGGVLIIGVTDDTRHIVGVIDVENRIKRLHEVTRRWIDYDRAESLIRVEAVVVNDGGGEKTCLVVAVAQAGGVVGVEDERRRFSYPVREGTGIAEITRKELQGRKNHLKVDDNFGFVEDLARFLDDH